MIRLQEDYVEIWLNEANNHIFMNHNIHTTIIVNQINNPIFMNYV